MIISFYVYVNNLKVVGGYGQLRMLVWLPRSPVGPSLRLFWV